MKQLLTSFPCRLVPRWAVLVFALLLGSRPTMAQAPPNDDCAQAVSVPVMANCSMPLNGTVQGATQSLAPNASCGLGSPIANDVWYTFVADGSSQQITLAPRFPAVLDVRSGTCTTSTSVFCANIFTNNTSPTLVSGLTSGQTYFIRVYASGNTPPAGISSTFAVCVSPAPVPITNDDCAQAIPVTVAAGCASSVAGTLMGATQSLPPTSACGFTSTANDVWYSFTATGTSQTVTLNANFPGVVDVRSGTCTASNSVFCSTAVFGQGALVTGLTSGQPYFIRVYANTSFPPVNLAFTLCVGPGLVLPINDDCASATPVTVASNCAAPVNGTIASATQSLPPSTTCGFASVANDVWYSFVATATTHSITLNSSFNAVLDVRSGTCGASSSVFCSTAFAGQGVAVSGLTSGQSYFIRIYNNSAFPPASSTFTLCVGPSLTPPANDECAGAVPLTVAAGCPSPVTGTVTNASQSLPATTNCGFTPVANDVWYSFTATGPTQTITLNAGFTAVLDVRSGTCGASSSVFCSTSGFGQGVVASGLTSGQSYFLRVYNSSPGLPFSSTFTVCVSPGPTPPANDECAGAVPVPVTTNCASFVSGTIANASQSLPATTNCGFVSVANDVWYSFTATGATQTITVNANFSALLDVRSGTCAASSSVFCTTVPFNQGVAVSGLTSGQSYFLRVYNGNSFPPSNSNFTLCITAGPPPSANDECASAVAVAVVQSCTASTNGSVFNATQSLPPTANCSAGVNNAADVWYSFVASAPTQLITLNPRFEAVLDVRSGTCTSSSSLLCASVFPNTTTGTVVGGLTTGQTYYARIYSRFTSPTAFNATFTLCITPAPTPPANDECANATVVPVTATCGTPVAGTVEAASQSLAATTACGGATVAQDVWYQFVASGTTQLITLNARFGAVLDVRSGTCATSTSLVCLPVFSNSTTGTLIGGLTSGQSYFIRVYASGSGQPSPLNATFTLCVNPGPTPPANDDCVGAIALPITTTCVSPTSGTVAAASQSLPPTANCGPGSGNAADVWYSFVATGPAHLLTLSAPQFLAVLDVRSGPCATSTSVFCQAITPGPPQPTAVGGLTAGQTYFIRIYAGVPILSGNSPAFTLCVTTPPTPPANDDCAGALPVPVQFGTTCVGQTSADNTAATGSTGVPAPTCAAYQGGDVWFRVTVPAGGVLAVRTVVPTSGVDVGDTGLSVYSGTCTSLTQIGCDDDSGGGDKSLLNLSGRTPGEELFIRVWAYDNLQLGTVAVCATAPTNCPTPSALLASNLTTTAADLSWQPGGSPAAGTTYTVEYGLQGFVLGAGTTATGITGPTFQLTSLLPSTNYCYYVRQNCPSPNGSSAYAGPVCFSTAAVVAPCPAPSAPVAISAAPTTAQLSWQPGGTPAAGTTYTVEYGLPGFTPGTGTVLANVPNPALLLTGLTANTNYCYYVRQQCPGATGASGLAGPACFRTPTATRAQAETNALVVYPNPSNTGQLTLRLSASHAAGQAMLLNALGQQVLRKAVAAGTAEETLRTTGLAAGVYTLRVTIGHAAFTRKVVLE